MPPTVSAHGTRHRYRWVILAVGVLATVSYSSTRMGMPALSPALRETFGVDLSGIGVVLGSLAVGQLLTTYAWGRLADRRGERLVLGMGLAGAAGALVAAALARDLIVLMLALMVAGMFGSSAVTGSGRAVMGWFPRSERGTALGIRQMGMPLGGALGGISLPLIAVATSLHTALLFLAFLLLVGSVAAVIWVRAPPEDGAMARPTGPSLTPLRDRRIWRLAVGSACLLGVQAAILAFVVLFLHDERRLSVTQAAACFSSIQVMGALIRPAIGRWSDRDGRRMPHLIAIAVAGAVTLTLTAMFAQSAPIALAIAMLITAGVLAMSWNGLANTAVVEIAGRQHAGAALGVQTTLFALGSGLMPPLFGVIVEMTSWSLAFGVLALLQVGAVIGLRPLVADEAGRLKEGEEAPLPAAGTVVDG